MTGQTQIFTDIDYQRDGKQVGWLQLPYSVTRSAYGNIAIPIAVVKNGPGPTVLLTAGTHGDEYEGQIAFCNLIRELQADAVSGRVIIMPGTNFPAVMAGLRVSPLDGGNLNRAYPGDPEGTPTSAIAHYVDSVLLPMADFYLDVHAGGASLQYQEFVSMRLCADERLNQRTMAAMKAFGAPRGMVWAHAHGRGFAVLSAIQRGIVALAGEYGGAGAVSREGLAIVERGVRNLLAHAGVTRTAPGPSEPMQLIEVRSRDYYVLAPDAGVFEPATELGQEVRQGDLCGRVHFIDDPARLPAPAYFRIGGTVVCKRAPGRVERGDCVAHLCTPYQG